jgi:hypothetical protein
MTYKGLEALQVTTEYRPYPNLLSLQPDTRNVTAWVRFPTALRRSG